MSISYRFHFAARYALRHALLSLLVALASAAVVFGLWYPTPYRQMLNVGQIYLLVLLVDLVCGPQLTLILASPTKSCRERWLDFSLIGLVQLGALLYGMHSVWVARPVVLSFEADRLVVVTANEIDHAKLAEAPEGLRRLPFTGVLHVGTRQPRDNKEFITSVEQGLAGLSPAMRPGWWRPWQQQIADMQARAKPLAELIARRPQDAQVLRDAAQAIGVAPDKLLYLPLTSSKVKEWVALLDAQMNMVGWAPVDGF